jgi:exopolysaccharide biosynthesis polyprenyl glycosylphosphotransferase
VESIPHTSEAPTASAGVVTPEPAVTRGRRWLTPPPGSRARLQLDLQRRAQYNLRRHVLRAAFRFAVLVLADIGSFGVMRALIRAVRDEAVLGGWIAQRLSEALPAGILNGWQYAAALFVALLVLGCYGAGDRRRDAHRLFAASALATALPLWMTIWTRGLDVVLLQYAVTTSLVWLGLLSERWTVDRVVDWVRPPERTAARTLFVGRAEDCAAVAGTPAFRDPREFASVGFVDLRVPPSPESRGHLVELARVLHESRAETVVVCGQPSDMQLEDVARAALATGCQLLELPRGVDIAGVEPGIVWRRGQPLVTLTAPTLKGWQLVVKRAVDLVGAVIGLAVAAPIMGIVAIAVRLDSPGPVLFRQERLGQGGRRFKITKFRTMVLDADRKQGELRSRSLYHDGRLFKVPDDPRITAVGRWLRRSSLDELPQLVNVLLGEMSLVGPRPPLPSEVELYEAHHYARFDVKPGITGPWQVGGRNDIVDFEEVVRMETAYIRGWSLWADVAILLSTIPAVFRMRGAH